MMQTIQNDKKSSGTVIRRLGTTNISMIDRNSHKPMHIFEICYEDFSTVPWQKASRSL